MRSRKPTQIFSGTDQHRSKTDSEDEPSVLDLVPAEIQENANLQTGRFQHIQQLSFVAPIVLRRDFDFYEHCIINNHVAVVLADDYFLVANSCSPLPSLR